MRTPIPRAVDLEWKIASSCLETLDVGLKDAQ